MTQFEKLDQMRKDNKGMVCAKDAAAAGISRTVFYDYVHERRLDKFGPGIYLDDDAWPDYQYMLHLRHPQFVFSHESALLFHDLTDREPYTHQGTMVNGYNPTKLKDYGIKLYTVRPELYSVGLSTAETMYGRKVPCYDRERTIVDIIRTRRDIELQTYTTAIKEYMRCDEKDLHNLITYAKLFKVEKKVRTYTEVML